MHVHEYLHDSDNTVHTLYKLVSIACHSTAAICMTAATGFMHTQGVTSLCLCHADKGEELRIEVGG